MSEINDTQRSLIPVLVASGNGSLGAGASTTPYQAATTLIWVVAIGLSTAGVAVVGEKANVAANAGLSFVIKHFADNTTGLVITNNSGVSQNYSFRILGFP